MRSLNVCSLNLTMTWNLTIRLRSHLGLMNNIRVRFSKRNHRQHRFNLNILNLKRRLNPRIWMMSQSNHKLLNPQPSYNLNLNRSRDLRLVLLNHKLILFKILHNKYTLIKIHHKWHPKFHSKKIHNKLHNKLKLKNNKRKFWSQEMTYW